MLSGCLLWRVTPFAARLLLFDAEFASERAAGRALNVYPFERCSREYTALVEYEFVENERVLKLCAVEVYGVLVVVTFKEPPVENDPAARKVPAFQRERAQACFPHLSPQGIQMFQVSTAISAFHMLASVHQHVLHMPVQAADHGGNTLRAGLEAPHQDIAGVFSR